MLPTVLSSAALCAAALLVLAGAPLASPPAPQLLGPSKGGDSERAAARSLAWPTLTRENLGDWASFLAPAGEELGAEAIDWIPDFAEGVRAASRQGRPLLFWAMNGHPLGCT